MNLPEDSWLMSPESPRTMSSTTESLSGESERSPTSTESPLYGQLTHWSPLRPPSERSFTTTFVDATDGKWLSSLPPELPGQALSNEVSFIPRAVQPNVYGEQCRIILDSLKIPLDEGQFHANLQNVYQNIGEWADTCRSIMTLNRTTSNEF